METNPIYENGVYYGTQKFINPILANGGVDFSGGNIINNDNNITIPNSNGQMALVSQIPTKTSQLTNDSGFITSGSSGLQTNVLIGNCIIPTVTGDVLVDGTNLLTMLAFASTQTPNGNPISATNRIVLLLLPAIYKLVSNLTLEQDGIDIVGLSGNAADTVIISNETAFVEQVSNDNAWKNLTMTDCQFLYATVNDLSVMDNIIFIAIDNPAIQSCGFTGAYSNIKYYHNASDFDCYAFGGGATASGIFTNIQVFLTDTEAIVNDYSFGGNGIASGTFDNCSVINNSLGQNYSFGGLINTSGIFNDCISQSVGHNNSFGGYGGTDNGTYDYCQAISTMSKCFAFGGGGGISSGNYNNCKSIASVDDYSFGGFASSGGLSSGNYWYCEGGAYTFGSDLGTASGSYYFCKTTGGLNLSFGGGNEGGVFSGYAYKCEATGSTNYAFGGYQCPGIIDSCTATGDTLCAAFGGYTGNGTFINSESSSPLSDISFSGGGNYAGGYYDNIKMSGQWHSYFIDNANIKNSTIIATGTNQDGILNENPASVHNLTIYNCTIKSTGSGSSLNSTSVGQTWSVAHSRFNTPFGVNVTSIIATPYNVIDSNI